MKDDIKKYADFKSFSYKKEVASDENQSYLIIDIQDCSKEIKRKCFEVFNLIVGKFEIDYLAHPWKEYWCIFENDFKDEFEKQIFPKLSSLATLIRATQDNILKGDYDFKEKEIVLKYGGEIKKISKCIGIIEGKEANLRELCNKIIHVNKITIRLETSDKHPLSNGKNGYEQSKEGSTFRNYFIEIEDTMKEKGKEKIVKSEISLIRFLEEAMSYSEETVRNKYRKYRD